MKSEDIDLLRIKIKTILQVAYDENIDCIILGTIGYGGWKNQTIDTYLFKTIFAIKPCICILVKYKVIIILVLFSKYLMNKINFYFY